MNNEEKQRLKDGIVASLFVPFIDDIENFVWEAIFHHVKGIHLPDPIREGRSKKLFDAVDTTSGTGWSLKALQRETVEVGTRFELVVQRADIFKKARNLGFDKLTINSPPEDLGEALIKHWNNKYHADADAQGVKNPRVAILLKRGDRKRFAYIELDYPPFEKDEFTWQWTSEAREGLQGFYKNVGQVKLRWYPGQKQLFECFEIPQEAFVFDIQWRRLETIEFINMLKSKILGV